MKPQVSIIVPIYNVEKYLERCIDSLLAQTFTNFELLLIDDGSPDNCGAICDEYEKKDSRIRVFHKENGGVSSARSLGTLKAVGKYSIHVDPDDYVLPTMLEELYNKAVEEDADMVICDYYSIKDNNIKLNSQNPNNYNHKIIIKEFLNGRLMGSLCNKLIKHELYENYGIKYYNNINHGEDLLIILQLLKHNIKITYLNKAFYYYIFYNNHFNLSSYNSNLQKLNVIKELYVDEYRKEINAQKVHIIYNAIKYKIYKDPNFVRDVTLKEILNNSVPFKYKLYIILNILIHKI